MSYKLNKTDGELLVELADGQIDTTTTDITLVGKNYKGFGEFFNENFIKMVENFAGTGAPGNPLVGQLWFDTNEQRLKLYDGSTFRTAGGPIVSSTQPNMVAGDIWIDNENNKLYFFDGTDLVLVGPDYDSAQGQTGFEVASVIDISTRERVVLKLWVGGVLFGVVAKEEFRLSYDNKIAGYPDDPDDLAVPKRQLFKPGFNFTDESYWFYNTATSARALVDADGNTYDSTNFLPTTTDGETVGSITIKNSNGISVGIADTQYIALKIEGTTSTLEAQQSGTNIAFKTRSGNSSFDAIKIDGANSRVGIFQSTPQYELDVTGSVHASGNLIVDGDLTVSGNATYINVANLQVEDKNIELGIADGSYGDDTIADGGGIILKSTDGDKTIVFENAIDSFTVNQNVNITSGNTYKINGVDILSATELATSVTVASGITQVGTLTNLDVDNINLNSNSITVASTGLNIVSNGDITVNNSKIADVADPTNAQDVTTKAYVDAAIYNIPTSFSLDITGLSAPDAPGVNDGPTDDVKAILDDIAPVDANNNGAFARVHCTSYTSATVSGISVTIGTSPDTSQTLTKSYVDVSGESVVQDIAASNTTSGTLSLTPARYTMTFEVQSGVWVHTGTSNFV